jgi:YVTN family beta-propeller protein
VINGRDGTVSVIDTTTNKVVGSPIAVGTNPLQVAITPDGTLALVVNYGSNSVSVVNTANNTVAATVAVGVGSLGVAATPDG